VRRGADDAGVVELLDHLPANTARAPKTATRLEPAGWLPWTKALLGASEAAAV
jgi:hypothetical protein